MEVSMSRREQLSVPIDAATRALIAEAAERDDRTIASFVRRAATEAARRQVEQQGEAA
jgi:uncharacterized protein (DUF1778 family)